MAEPAVDPALQLTDPALQPAAQEPTPLANGTSAPADIEMADSQPIHDLKPFQEVSHPALPSAPSTTVPNNSPATRPRSTHTRAHPTSTTTPSSILAQQPTPQRAGPAGAHAADTAWQSDAGVLEPECDAASARGDEAFGDDGAGEAA
jgi:hypothetical protein